MTTIIGITIFLAVCFLIGIALARMTEKEFESRADHSLPSVYVLVAVRKRKCKYSGGVIYECKTGTADEPVSSWEKITKDVYTSFVEKHGAESKYIDICAEQD